MRVARLEADGGTSMRGAETVSEILALSPGLGYQPEIALCRAARLSTALSAQWRLAVEIGDFTSE